MELFYYQNQKRLGPVNSAQIRALAARGEITPETIVEAGGKSLPAAKIKGLEFPAPVPPAVPADPDPPAAVPFVAPYGGVQYIKPEEKPAAPEIPSSERAQAELRLAAQFVDSSCVALKAVGWLFYIGAAVSFFGGIIAAANTENFAFIGIGLAGLAAGWSSAQIPFALEKMGRFLLAWTRFHNDN